MDPILIYGFPQGSSMGLIAALEWLGAPYRLCRVDMLGEMRDPLYARINARHETPAFVTPEGAIITETMAIAAWLEARDAESRISFDPRDPRADRMHQLMAYVNTGFTGAFSPLWSAMEMDDPDPATVAVLRDWGRAAVIERHDKLEAMIGDGPWLVGDRPSLADALFVGVARWLDFHDLGGAGRWPRLAAMRQRIEADPAVRHALAVEAGDPSAGSGACRGHIALEEVIDRFGA